MVRDQGALRTGIHCLINLFTFALLSLPNRPIPVLIILLSPRPSSSLVLAEPLQLTWRLVISAEEGAVLLRGWCLSRILHVTDVSETRVERWGSTAVIECIIYLHHFFINLIIIHN